MDRKKRTIGYVALAFGGFVATMIVASSYLLGRWSELRPAGADEAERAFAAARVAAGDGPPYLEITQTGGVQVHREREHADPAALESLDLLAWDPDRGKLLRISFPFWFVRLKMSDTVNLGTLTTALARDWRKLDLKVSVEELRRAGPGIVLDHRLAGGGRVLLWTRPPVGKAGGGGD